MIQGILPCRTENPTFYSDKRRPQGRLATHSPATHWGATKALPVFESNQGTSHSTTQSPSTISQPIVPYRIPLALAKHGHLQQSQNVINQPLPTRCIQTLREHKKKPSFNERFYVSYTHPQIPPCPSPYVLISGKASLLIENFHPRPYSTT